MVNGSRCLTAKQKEVRAACKQFVIQRMSEVPSVSDEEFLKFVCERCKISAGADTETGQKKKNYFPLLHLREAMGEFAVFDRISERHHLVGAVQRFESGQDVGGDAMEL